MILYSCCTGSINQILWLVDFLTFRISLLLYTHLWIYASRAWGELDQAWILFSIVRRNSKHSWLRCEIVEIVKGSRNFVCRRVVTRWKSIHHPQVRVNYFEPLSRLEGENFSHQCCLTFEVWGNWSAILSEHQVTKSCLWLIRIGNIFDNQVKLLLTPIFIISNPHFPCHSLFDYFLIFKSFVSCLGFRFLLKSFYSPSLPVTFCVLGALSPCLEWIDF